MKTADYAYAKNAAIVFIWWITGLLLIASTLWAAKIYDDKYYAQAINRVLKTDGDKRRVLNDIPIWGRDGRSALSSSRFLLNDSRSRAIVYPINYGSLTCTFVAIWSPLKGIEKTYPLNAKAAAIAQRLPPGIGTQYQNKIAAMEYIESTPEKRK